MQQYKSDFRTSITVVFGENETEGAQKHIKPLAQLKEVLYTSPSEAFINAQQRNTLSSVPPSLSLFSWIIAPDLTLPFVLNSLSILCCGFLRFNPPSLRRTEWQLLHVQDENKLPPHLSSFPVKRQNWQVLNTIAYGVKEMPFCNFIWAASAWLRQNFRDILGVYMPVSVFVSLFRRPLWLRQSNELRVPRLSILAHVPLHMLLEDMSFH